MVLILVAESAMSKLRLATIAITTVILLLGNASSSSAATTALRKSPGNALLTVGSTVTSTAGSLDLTTDTGGIHCQSQKLAMRVILNESSPSVPAALESWTFSTCTSTFAVIGISECAVIAPMPTITIVAGVNGGTMTFGTHYLRCTVKNTNEACYYTATTAGNFANANSSAGFFNVGITYGAPAGTTDAVSATTCGSDGAFDAVSSTFRPESGGEMFIATT